MNNETTFAEDARDSQEKGIPQRAEGTAAGEPSQAEGSRPQPTFRTSERAADIRQDRPPNDEEYLSGMIRTIMKESMQRQEDKKDWGFAPSKTPFTEKILKAKFPKNFVPPTIPAYQGTSDPNQFLYRYDWHMTGARASDEIKCRYFPVYLEGVALL